MSHFSSILYLLKIKDRRLKIKIKEKEEEDEESTSTQRAPPDEALELMTAN